MLGIGTTAPPMALEDTEGHPVTLADIAGQADRRGVLLFFMRSAACPVCNAHVRNLIKQVDKYVAAGVQIVIAVPEGRDEAAKWKSKNGIPFPVVTGRGGSAHETVGLAKRVFGSMRQSGSILVDAHNTIRHAHGATMPTNSYDKKGIAAAVDELQAASASTPPLS
jgi:peroxiredoxin